MCGIFTSKTDKNSEKRGIPKGVLVEGEDDSC